MLISIVTPVKNGAAYIAEAMQSVVSQSYPLIELVIVDGGSTDGTLDVIQHFYQHYPKVIKLIHGTDSGACEALNKGWRIVKGDVLGWLGSDDRLLPGAIKTVAEYFLAHPDRCFLYGGCEVINGNGDYIGRFATREFNLETALNKGLYVPFPSAFYRRRVIDTTGFVDSDHKACDSDFIIRASKHYTLYRIKTNLVQFRLHCKSISCTSGVLDFPEAIYKLNRKYGGKLISPVGVRYAISLFNKLRFFSFLFSLALPWHYRSNPAALLQHVSIFGASLSGYQCMQAAIANGSSVHSFIDNFPPGNNLYCRRPVYTPTEFITHAADQVDAVLIASSSSKVEMWRQLRRLRFKKPIKFFRGTGYQ